MCYVFCQLLHVAGCCLFLDHVEKYETVIKLLSVKVGSFWWMIVLKEVQKLTLQCAVFLIFYTDILDLFDLNVAQFVLHIFCKKVSSRAESSCFQEPCKASNFV